MSIRYYLFFVLTFLLFACDEDTPADLPPVEERVAEAISNLRSELTAPANGWILEYRPTDDSGFFKVLLKFGDDGKVNIQTDALANEGEFFDQTITYRIDNAQGLELILETYGFFHYLFEQEQATYGGEFEFSYERKDGENLVFGSLSDFSNRTVLVFKPANTADEASIQQSRQLAELLQTSLDGSGPQFIPAVRFQLAIPDFNATAYFAFDFNTRNLKAIAVSEGLTEEEVIANNNTILLNQSSGYGFSDGNILLEQPIAIALGGQQVIITQIALSSVAEQTITYCNGQEDNQFVYDASVLGAGTATASTGLFAGSTAFQPLPQNPYSVNITGIIDENGESIVDEITALFPGAVAFQMYYGFDFGDETFNALGFVTVNESNETDFLLRRYELTTNGNKFTFNFLDDYFTTRDLTPEEEAGFAALTDEVFGGSEIYVLDYAGNDELFNLFNPCNRYEIFLLN